MKLKITDNTFIKSSTEQSANLEKDDLFMLMKGVTFPVESVESVGSHWKVSAYIYKDHCEVIGGTPRLEKPERMSDAYGSVSDLRALEMLKQFEGLRLKAYQDSAGVWTIGYGHTKKAYPGMVITRAEAERLLRQDLVRFERAVRDRATVPLTQNQFDALVSFSFNVGVGAFSKSTLLKRLNQKDYAGAKQEFKRWVYAGGRRLQGLVNRREREAQLFLSG